MRQGFNGGRTSLTSDRVSQVIAAVSDHARSIATSTGERKHEPVELRQENTQEVVARIVFGIDDRPRGLSDDVEFAERWFGRECPAGLLGRRPPLGGVPAPEDPQDGRIRSPPRRQCRSEFRRAVAAVAVIVRSRGKRSPRCNRHPCSRRRECAWRSSRGGRRAAEPRH